MSVQKITELCAWGSISIRRVFFPDIARQYAMFVEIVDFPAPPSD
jgi:hypothetical protein